MFRPRLLAVVVLAVLTVSFVVTRGQTGPATMAQPADSPAAARAQYEADVHRAREKLVADLEAARDKASKAGDLEEALRIRDFLARIVSMPNEPVPAAAATEGAAKAPVAGPEATVRKGTGPAAYGAGAEELARTLSGTIWKKSDGRNEVTFNADMSVTTNWHPHAGTWVPISRDTIRYSGSMNNCGGYIITLSKDGKSLVDDQARTDLTFNRRTK